MSDIVRSSRGNDIMHSRIRYSAIFLTCKKYVYLLIQLVKDSRPSGHFYASIQGRIHRTSRNEVIGDFRSIDDFTVKFTLQMVRGKFFIFTHAHFLPDTCTLLVP